MTQITRRLGAFFIALLPLVANAATTWELDWENALTAANVRNTTEGYWWHGNCFIKPGDTFNSVESSTKYARTGSKSLRMTRHSMIPNIQGHNNCESFVKSEDDRHRNEVRYGYGQGAFESWSMGDERWVRMSVYIPSDEGNFSTWNSATSKRIMLAQWIGSNPSFTHEVALLLGGGPVIKVDGYVGTSTTSESSSNVVYGSFNAKKDSWNDIIVRHRRSWQTAAENPTGHGIVQVWANCADWANCTPVIDYSGRAAIRYFSTGWFKAGLYGNTSTWDHQHVVYFDTIKMGIRDAETDAQMLAIMADDYTGSGSGGAATLVYDQDFESGYGDIFKKYECRTGQYTLIDDPSDAGNQVAKLYQPGDKTCFEENDNVYRHRTYMVVGSSVDLSAIIPSVDFTGYRVLNGQNTWYGFRFFVDDSTPDGSDRFFLVGAEVGEPALLIKGNDTLNVMPERYRTFSNGNWGPLVENYVTNHAIIKDGWNDIVVRWYRRFDYQGDGIFQVWLNGEKVVDLSDIVTGSDRIAAGGLDPTIKIGIYFGEGNRAGNWTALIDDIKIAIGSDGYALVAPGGASKPGPDPDPDPDIPPEFTDGFSVNSGNPIDSLQDPINFTASDVDDITNCTMGGSSQSIPLAVKFNYTTGTSGKFYGVDTSSFGASGTVICYDESYVYNPDISSINMSEQNGAIDSKQTSLDHWGYTSGRRLTKAASGIGYAFWTYGSSYGVVEDDMARFDITYSCAGDSCNNMYFDVYHADTTNGAKTLRFAGTAGSLEKTATALPEHGENVVIRNYTMPDDTYRLTAYWRVSEANNYKIGWGWLSESSSNLTMDLLEVVMRKNWTTAPITDLVVYVDDIVPSVDDCAMTNVRAAGDGELGYVASINCTADEIGGTDYAMITTSNTAPDAAAVQAGTGAIWSSQKSADTTEIAFEASGMSYQDLWGWIMRCDAADNCSTVQGVTFDDGLAPGEVKKIKFANNYDGMGGNRLIYTRDVNGNPVLYPEEETIDRLVILDGDPRYESPVAAPPVIATFRDLELDADGVLEVEETDVYSGSVNELEVGTPKWFMLWNLDGSFNALGTIKPIAE